MEHFEADDDENAAAFRFRHTRAQSRKGLLALREAELKKRKEKAKQNKVQTADSKIREQQQEEDAARGIGIFSGCLRVLRDEETAEERVERLQAIMCLMAFLEVAASVMMLVYLYWQENNNNTFRNVFGAIVGIAASVMGLWAGVKRAEFLARLAFVMQIWLLNLLTVYMMTAVQEWQGHRSSCTPSTGISFSTTVDRSCDIQRPALEFKLASAVFGVFFSLISAIVALDFDDAINDFSGIQSSADDKYKIDVDAFKGHHMDPKDIKNKADKHWHLKFADAEGPSPKAKVFGFSNLDASGGASRRSQHSHHSSASVHSSGKRRKSQ